jgi:hypothetical protein
LCEPHHSINQYPSDDSDEPTGIGAPNESRLRVGLQKLGDWLRRIGGYFHLSKLGSGHTESQDWALTRGLWLPPEIRYEARWWDRQVVFDTSVMTITRLRESGRYDEALEAATAYAHQTSIGSLFALRRFLEGSLAKSERPLSYAEHFLSDLLNLKGQTAFLAKVVRVVGRDWRCQIQMEKFPLDRFVKLILGFTRKREYMNDSWADSSLWTPKIVTA